MKDYNNFILNERKKYISENEYFQIVKNSKYDINKYSEYLLISLNKEYIQIANYILDNFKINPNYKNQNGRSLLYNSIKLCDYNIFKKLVKYKNINLKEIFINGENALMYAISKRNKASKIINYLYDKVNIHHKNIYSNKNILWYCLYNNNYDVFKKMIDDGVDVNNNDKYENLLMWLSHVSSNHYLNSKYDEYDYMKLLLENGIDVNWFNNKKETALSVLIDNIWQKNNYKKLIILLFDYNTTWNTKSIYKLIYINNEFFDELIRKYPDIFEKYLRRKEMDKFNI